MSKFINKDKKTFTAAESEGYSMVKVRLSWQGIHLSPTMSLEMKGKVLTQYGLNQQTPELLDTLRHQLACKLHAVSSN